MNFKSFLKATLSLILCLGLTSIVMGQVQYGNIYGSIVDEEGVPLAGVTVTLESDLIPTRTLVTTEGGFFRFLNLPPGTYKVTCELPGFNKFIQENINVVVGGSVTLKITMTMAKVEEEIIVTAVSPVVDTKKTGISTNITSEILTEIPSARDPWVILDQVPGIMVDRVNIGGSQSGQQSNFVSKGSHRNQAQWNVDGINITDQAATGASPTYYDFDTFEEMQIVTSGADPSIQTGGVSINFVTKRGGNKFRAEGRFFITDDSFQSKKIPEEAEKLGYKGDRIRSIYDYGLQIGGPIIKDRLWFWLGYGVQDIKMLTAADYPDDTKLVGYNAKINVQISKNNRAEFAFMLNDKKKWGRGASPTRPPETTWDQKGPSPYFKFEDEHIFGPNFYLSFKAAYMPMWFELAPKGGMDVQAGLDLATGMWSGSYGWYHTERPQADFKIDGNYFVEEILGGDHEFKFGVEYRWTPTTSIWEFAGNVLKLYWNGAPYLAEIGRQGHWDYKSDRYSFYIGDTFTKGRLTLNLGLRFDSEKSVNNPSTIPASKVAPDFLGEVKAPGSDPGVRWNTLSPRIGFTYDLTGDGKTIIRGNIARYGTQMGSWLATHISPVSDAGAGYFWNDLNGDDTVQTNELWGYPTAGLLWWYGFDPANPNSPTSPNKMDKDLVSPLTDEIILGIEREIIPDFSLGANLILRRNHRFWWTPYFKDDKVFTKDDYVVANTVTWEGKTYTYYTLTETRPAGTYMTQRPDYHENYTGIEIIAVKRLSHRWMLNASFTYNNHIRHYGDNGYLDPTNLDMLEGTYVAPQTGGSGKTRIWIGARWQFKMSGLYQLPYGFNISGFLNAREGYVYPKYIKVATPERGAVGLGATTDLYIEPFGTSRLPTFWNLDLRLEKVFKIGEYGKVYLIADAFNIFDSGILLGKFPQQNSPRAGEGEEWVNPRVFRFAIRYVF
jgi:hypothetical protein